MAEVCAVTGANGYVGSCVARELVDTGWEVRALLRPGSQPASSAWTSSSFELGGELEPGALAGARALVHLAHDYEARSWTDVKRINVEGSRRLFAAARESGVERILFVSSTAAFPGARSMYGRAKLEIERVARDNGAAIVRPGLVWGSGKASMFGALQRAVERLPVVPLVVPPGLELSMVHEEDLAEFVCGLLRCRTRCSDELLVAAAEQRITFIDLLRSLACRTGRRPRFVRFPWRGAWLGLRVIELLGMSPPFRSDSLLSLATSDPEPGSHATDSVERYGVRLRPYPLRD
ncbi:MAG TPA: NAD-dependent epimerase/dehydratase family protein [Solirubrobacteraceae bacterium]|nr:NAD-dependent epimerase/dehydratase family protein [Solirubrobacteraceae bacterium]